MSAPTLLVEPSLEALAARAAEEIMQRAAQAIATRGLFTWVLSGGTTPRDTYRLLARTPRYRDAIAWERVHFFWSDERHVGPEHPDSNYRLARETMLSGLAVPSANIHRMLGESPDAQAAASAYEDELKRFFGLDGDALPRFDLALLGMGADGHTASLFPGAKALSETRRRVVAPWVEKLKASRVTLTAPTLNASRCVLFLVAGGEKAEALMRTLEGPRAPEQLPCQLIRPREGELLWLVDGAASSQLTSKLAGDPT
jgi:6-phosphogluconolactonase